MHFSRITLAAIGAGVLFTQALAQTPTTFNAKATGRSAGSILKAPDYMRLCIPITCSNLTLRGDHYDGTDDAGVLGGEGKLVRWDRDSVVLTARTLRPDTSGNIATGTFTGVRSGSDHSMIGTDVFDAGPNHGTFSFKLTWEDASVWDPASGSGICFNSKNYENVYQAEHSPDAGYNLARASLGMKDYANASCWAHVGEKQGGSRILTLLGVVYSNPDYEGYNPPRAFQYLKQAAEMGDPKAEYLLSLAYHDGIGTPHSEGDAAAWKGRAMATDEGRALAAEQQQQYPTAGPQQAQMNPWMVLAALFLGGMVGSGDSDVQLDACGQDVSKPGYCHKLPQNHPLVRPQSPH